MIHASVCLSSGCVWLTTGLSNFVTSSHLEFHSWWLLWCTWIGVEISLLILSSILCIHHYILCPISINQFSHSCSIKPEHSLRVGTWLELCGSGGNDFTSFKLLIFGWPSSCYRYMLGKGPSSSTNCWCLIFSLLGSNQVQRIEVTYTHSNKTR